MFYWNLCIDYGNGSQFAVCVSVEIRDKLVIEIANNAKIAAKKETKNKRFK